MQVISVWGRENNFSKKVENLRFFGGRDGWVKLKTNFTAKIWLEKVDDVCLKCE